jgi:hypothetical protein
MSIVYEIYFVLLLVSLSLYAIPLKNKGLYRKWILLLLTLWLITSASAIYLSTVAKWKNNLFIFHISTPLEYLILAMLYRSVIINERLKKIIAVSIPVFIGFSVLSSLFLQKPDENNSYAILLESVLVISITLFYLREVLLLRQIPELHRFAMFWISAGVLFYYAGNLLVEGLLNYMIAHSITLARRAYFFGHVFKYLIFILLITGVLIERKPPALSNNQNLDEPH